jgi:integrase/recombinase XerD
MGRKLPQFLNDREPELLLKATRTQRDRVMLMAMLYLGLRVSEVCKLRIEDIDFGRGFLFVRQGKGSKDRGLPVPGKFLPILRGWIGPRTSGYVFPSRQGGDRLSARAVQLLMKRVAARAGLQKAAEPRAVTPHKLRHAFASRMLARGADIEAVREAMGHSDLATTSVYLHCTPERLRNAMEF